MGGRKGRTDGPRPRDAEKGILNVMAPGPALQHLLTSDCLHAVEVNDGDASLLPYLDDTIQGYVRPLGRLPQLASSDAHSLSAIGKRFTWIKMTRPDLEGLRLAFQDGPLSVLRSDEAPGEPNSHAALTIEEIEIRDAKYLGRGKPFQVRLNPWLNAVIGGRGTGKSPVVEFLRTALRRE